MACTIIKPDFDKKEIYDNIPQKYKDMSDAEIEAIIAEHGGFKTIGYASHKDPVTGGAIPTAEEIAELKARTPVNTWKDHPDRLYISAEYRLRITASWERNIRKSMKESAIGLKYLSAKKEQQDET